MRPLYKKIWLIIEFIFLFFGVPLLILFNTRIVHPSAIILPILIAVFIYLNRQPYFHFKDFIKFNINKNYLKRHVLFVIIISLVLLLGVYLFDRENLFNLPKGNLFIWIALCIFYPLFSAFGQEIIYRVFLYYRYRNIFKNQRLYILASAITFSFVHIVYYSHISIILTLFLGIYLAAIYLKTKSVLLTSLIHGFLGNVIFTIGLGSYFWLDMFKWL